MRTLKIFFIFFFTICSIISRAQNDTVVANQHALEFADSLVKAWFFQDWKTYQSLSCPAAIQYYGGKEGFASHITSMYYHNEPTLVENPETLHLISLLNDRDEWQCVIEKMRDTYINNRKAKVYTYLVGQSKDNGMSWKFVDVSHNSTPNLIYIMPDIFDTLAIPFGKTVFEDEAMTQPKKKRKMAAGRKKSYASK